MIQKRKIVRKNYSLNEFVEGIKENNRTILSKAVTLLESTNKDSKKLAEHIIEQCLPYSGKSLRIGITGVPGVGKSTFIESFGTYLTSLGKKVAILAIDPSSEKSKGSILGDKTRMEKLSSNKNAFIRPSPSAGSLGGVARATRESVILFEAAGYDTIIIETVGVGQSETAVHSMVDCFLLLMLAGAGDELQGIKRGIMEMADIMLINKADGDNEKKAKRAKVEYQNALHLFPANENGWIPKVETCSALNNFKIDTVWKLIESFINNSKNKGFFKQNRQEQAKYWFHEYIGNTLLEKFYSAPTNKQQIIELENRIIKGELNPHSAAENLIARFF